MYTGSKKNNLLFFLTLLFFSCVKEKNTSVAISLTQQKNDSISQYIASSQNKNLTPSEQKKMRFKALDSINALTKSLLLAP